MVRTFSKISGWEVRAITRNPNSNAARALGIAIPGIKVVRTDLDDAESLKSEFDGANAIFGVTDFWQCMPMYRTTWNEACSLREFQQGKNIIDATAQTAPQLDRLVLSSLIDARKGSSGKYTWVWHFDSKAQFAKYLASKSGEGASNYQTLLGKTSSVQIGYYLDNWKINPFYIPKKVRYLIDRSRSTISAVLVIAAHNLQDFMYVLTTLQEADGTIVFRSTIQSNTDKSSGKERETETTNYHLTPFVNPPTDTGPFIESLVLKAPPGTTMLGTSSPMQFNDYIKLWGQLQGSTPPYNT